MTAAQKHMGARTILGFSAYEARSDGTIWSKTRFVRHNYGGQKIVRAQQIKGKQESNGYLRATIRSDDGSVKTMSVHRLILMAFTDCAFHNMHVNHINGNKRDNSLENLEWVTPRENMRHAIKTGLMPKLTHMKGRFGARHNRSKPVESFNLFTGSVVKRYPCCQATKYDGMSPSSVVKCAKNKSKAHRGLGWRYA